MSEKPGLHRGLRFTGFLYKIFISHFTEKKLKSCQKLISLAKGHHSRKMKCTEKYIKRADGSTIRICVYRPKKGADKVKLPGLLWLHGGGYAMGTPEIEEFYAEMFTGAGCVVIMPDYRLSVKSPYPCGLDDCMTALYDMYDNALEYGIDENRLCVGGDSAGGGLTVAVCLRARDEKKVKIKYQFPIYPMLDDRVTSSSENNDMPFWNTRSNTAAWKLYLGDKYGKEDVPFYACPARESDYSGLPPSFTYVGTLDPFYDETLAYTAKLRKSGVFAECLILDACCHGFDTVNRRMAPSKKAHSMLIDVFGKYV